MQFDFINLFAFSETVENVSLDVCYSSILMFNLYPTYEIIIFIDETY
jgi:hypothetical protein